MFRKLNSKIQDSARFLLTASAGLVLASSSLTAYAQNTNNYPEEDLTSNPFVLDMQAACKTVARWVEKEVDDGNGGTNTVVAPRIFNEDEICVSQSRLYVDGQVQVPKYKDFETIPATVDRAKVAEVFNEDDVVAITEQNLNIYENNNVVEAGTSHNRAGDVSLDKVFTGEYQSKIFNSESATDYIPKKIWTGPNTFTVNAATGRIIYQGGNCEIENGKYFVRSPIQYNSTTTFDLRDLGVDEQNPEVSCAPYINGQREDRVFERALKVYQYIYEVSLPDRAGCDLVEQGIDLDKCHDLARDYMRNQWGKLASFPSGDFDRILLTWTYYGSFDDGSKNRRSENFIVKPTSSEPNHVVIENSSATGPSFATKCRTNGQFDADKCIDLPEPANGIKVIIRATASNPNSLTDRNSDEYKEKCLTDGKIDTSKCYFVPKSGLVAFQQGNNRPEVGRADQPGDTIIDLHEYSRDQSREYAYVGGSTPVVNRGYDAYEEYLWNGWKNPDVDLFTGPRRDFNDGFVRFYDGVSVYVR